MTDAERAFSQWLGANDPEVIILWPWDGACGAWLDFIQWWGPDNYTSTSRHPTTQGDCDAIH